MDRAGFPGDEVWGVFAIGALRDGDVEGAAKMWREAEDALHRHLRSVEVMARPAAERSADWFERQTRALRDRFGEAQVGAGKSAEARTQEMVRVVRAAGAFTGAARVIDGDTLDVGGVRIRLHGIDAPESEQSCRAGGRRWSCGREATRALAGRIGKRTVGCQERDRDRLRPGRGGV